MLSLATSGPHATTAGLEQLSPRCGGRREALSAGEAEVGRGPGRLGTGDTQMRETPFSSDFLLLPRDTSRSGTAGQMARRGAPRAVDLAIGRAAGAGAMPGLLACEWQALRVPLTSHSSAERESHTATCAWFACPWRGRRCHGRAAVLSDAESRVSGQLV